MNFSIPLVLLCSLIIPITQANIQIGSTANEVTLNDKLGGTVSGEAWSATKALSNNKVNLVFYIDPDNRTLNDDLADRLKAEKFPRTNYASTVVMNMAATWLPNDFLNDILKKKQVQFPDTTYVKDLDKVLVKEWNLPDDSYTVMAFDKSGKLFFRRDGKFAPENIEELVSGIRARLN